MNSQHRQGRLPERLQVRDARADLRGAVRRSRIALAILASVLGVVIAGFGPVSAPSAAISSYSIWPASTTPRTLVDPDRARVEVGTVFTSSVNGSVASLRVYRNAATQGSLVGTLWRSGVALSTVTFPAASSNGWQTAALKAPVAIVAGQQYVVSYLAPSGAYASTEWALSSSKPASNQALTALRGVYRYGGGFPTSSWHDSSYFVDIVFTPQATTTPTPTVTPTPTPTRTVTPTPTPTATVTPRPSASSSPAPGQGTGGTNCGIVPSSCGYPDDTNTGASASGLKDVPGQVTQGVGWHYDQRGWVEIDGAGAVFTGYRLTADIMVTADNVTVRNNLITRSSGWGVSLRHADNVIIDRNTIRGTAPDTQSCDNAIRDIYGDSDGVIITGNNIFYCNSGINHFNRGGLIQGNYIHDLGYPCDGPDCYHFNGIQLGAGSGSLMTINHNTIFNPRNQTDAIMLANDDGPQTNRIITNNLLAGGGYSFYGSGGPNGQATNIVFTGNRFSTRYFANGGYWGPVAHWQRAAVGNVWTNNTWADGPRAGAAITP